VGASDPGTTGYVPRLLAFLRGDAPCGDCGAMQLEQLAQPGATSADVLAEQLPAALTAIAAGNVRVVTLDVGGDDGIAQAAACAGGLSPACLEAAQGVLATFQEQFAAILAQLREAGGGSLRIIVLAYDNPLRACDEAALAPLADIFLEGGPGIEAGLNDIIRTTAATYDAGVADAFGLFSNGDLVGGSDCLHPADSGYAIIAQQFAAVWTAIEEGHA
jgi:lysophospholipase L1-like esterase